MWVRWWMTVGQSREARRVNSRLRVLTPERTAPTTRRQNMSRTPMTAATADASGMRVSGPIYMVFTSAGSRGFASLD